MNRAVKIRIYPNKEQRVQIEQTIGCSRFIYNQMLADKISYYQKEKKMLRNTPAGYKKEYPWLKEVDSLALANAQLHLESAFRKFFREPACGFPRYKSKKHARNSYTTNALNGNILLQDTHLKLPKMSVIRIKLHRQIPSDVSHPGNILPVFCSAVRTKQWKKDRQRDFLGSILPCRECVYFLQEKEPGTLCFTEKQRKNLQENRESSPTVKKKAGTIRNRKKG